MDLKEYYKKVLSASLVENSYVSYQSEPIPVDRSYDDVETIRALRPPNQATTRPQTYKEPEPKEESKNLGEIRKRREAEALKRQLGAPKLPNTP